MRLQKTIALIAVALPVIYFAASVHAAPQHLPLAPAFVQNQTAPSQTEQTQSPSSAAPLADPSATAESRLRRRYTRSCTRGRAALSYPAIAPEPRSVGSGE